MMHPLSPVWKHYVKHDVSKSGGETKRQVSHNVPVSESADLDWYFRAWMTHFGKKQVDLVKELGWQRARASKVWNGANPYRREVINEIARWLKLEPYELLLPPERALAIRAMYASAEKIVAGADRFLPPPPTAVSRHARRTGTSS